MLIIAHRGASAYAPENTLAAFDKALALGFQDVEMDIHMTRDGELVVMHDDVVDRTTNGKGAVEDLTLKEIKALDAGAWFDTRFAGERVPTLDEVMQRYKDKAYLHIEMKVAGDRAATKLVKLLDKHQMHERATITSFVKEALQQIKKASKEERVGWLVERWDEATIEETVSLGFQITCPLMANVTPEKVALAHQKQLMVRTWGAKTDLDIQRGYRCGVDGMTLDAPDRGRSVARISMGA